VSVGAAELAAARGRTQTRGQAKSWRAALSLVCLLVGGVYLIPLVWVASVSVRRNSEVFATRIVPHSFRLSNFSDAFHSFGLGRLLVNTAVITAGTVALSLALSVTAAYGFSRYRTRITEGVFVLILTGLMIPPAAIIVPFFLEMKNAGLYNTLSAVILGETAFVLPLAVLLLRGYIDQLPDELIAAARVDGATEWRAFRYVAFPLLKPAIATVALFITISTWNGFLLPLVLLGDPARATLTVGLSVTTYQFGQIQLAYVSAASLLAVIPVLVVFVAARRYYVQGLSAGALRG
jgi:ABC-type glycerol-3-phosphate transport system permease component